MAAAGVPAPPRPGWGAVRLEGAVEGGVDELEQLGAQNGADRLGVGGAQDLGLSAQLVHEGGGHLDTEVGGEEGVLDLLPVLLGEVTSGQDGQDRLAEAACTGQAGA